MIKLGADGIWFCREMEIEQLGLWPTVKRVSELSISEIRTQTLDPFHENLARNGGFDAGLAGWDVQPPGRAEVSRHGSSEHPNTLSIALAPDSRTTLSQIITHNPSPVVALRSIGLSIQSRAVGFQAVDPVTVALDLRYSDGSEESHAFTLPTDTVDWRAWEMAVPVAYDGARCLEFSTVRVLCPPGEGVLRFGRLVVHPDPLHNPINPSTKDMSE